MATTFRLPPALRPGDVVVVVAPSSPCDHVLAWRGLGFLGERYRTRFTRGVFARQGFLAGSNERRRDELAAALADPDARAIIALRGGYGASHIAHRVGLEWLAEHPRWIIGFSDVTALHVEAARVHVGSLHGPNLTGLGRGDARMRDAFVRTLEQPLAARRYEGLDVVRPGVASGPLFGGNLALLQACAAAGRLRVPEGCVLLVEDVGERPYRLDRMLTTLVVGGHFARVAGVVIGDFTSCDPGPDGVTARAVLDEALGALGVPVVAGVPVGHGVRNDPVVLGGPARIEATGTTGALILGEG